MASVIASSGASRHIPPPPPPPPPPQIGRKRSAKNEEKSGLSGTDYSKAVNSLISEYPKFKTSMCFFFKKGRCANREDCRFAHGFPELKKHLPPPPRCKPSDSNVERMQQVLCKNEYKTPEAPHFSYDRNTETSYRNKENSDDAPSGTSDSVYRVTMNASPTPTTLSESPSLTLAACPCLCSEFHACESAITPRSCTSPLCWQEQCSSYPFWDQDTENRAALSLSLPIKHFQSSDAYDASVIRTGWCDYKGSYLETPCADPSPQVPPLKSVASASAPNGGSRNETRLRVLALISQMAEAAAPFRTGYYPHMDSSLLRQAESTAMQFSYLAALTCLNPLTTSKELKMEMQNVGCLSDDYD